MNSTMSDYVLRMAVDKKGVLYQIRIIINLELDQ